MKFGIGQTICDICRTTKAGEAPAMTNRSREEEKGIQASNSVFKNSALPAYISFHWSVEEGLTIIFFQTKVKSDFCLTPKNLNA